MTVKPPDNPARAARIAQLAVEPADLVAFSWQKLFGPDRAHRPIELEIGIGKGGFLLRRARAHPDRNFLGIEWASEFYRYALDRFARWNVPNVRLLRTDAGVFIRTVCPRDSLAVLHIYHPDPWPKRRHHKRRLFQPPFVNAAVACLVPGGRIAVQTDHAGYFDVIVELLRSHPQLREVPFADPAFGVEAARVATNFEIKYLKEGRPIYQIAMQRADAT